MLTIVATATQAGTVTVTVTAAAAEGDGMMVLDLFRGQAGNGATVIASLHDVNLAARYADECLLLFGDGHWLLGPTRDVLTTATLSDLYATPMETVEWRDGAVRRSWPPGGGNARRQPMTGTRAGARRPARRSQQGRESHAGAGSFKLRLMRFSYNDFR